MTVQVPGYDSYLYMEVWEITAWKDGAIYKTRSTGKYIKAADEGKLDKTKYFASSVSTSVSRQPMMTLELFPI